MQFMAPKPKSLAKQMPRPAGRIDAGAPPSEQTAPSPSTSVVIDSKKKPWHKKRRGRRDLLRAVAYKMKQVPENFSKLHEDPEQGHPKMKQYPSTRFLEEAEPWMLARYCNFLLQSVMMLTRVFRVPKKLSEIYGLGCSSAARLALLMMRTMQLQNPEAMQLKTVRRHLYARMLQESDDREQIQQTTKQEWAEDRLTNLNGRLDEFLLSHVCPGILEGRYPKTNLEADMAKQWDDVWKVPSIRVFNLPIARDSSTCETDTSDVGLCSKTVLLDVGLKFLDSGGDIFTISMAKMSEHKPIPVLIYRTSTG